MHVNEFVTSLFEEDVHAKRVESLANGVDGAPHATSVGVRALGQGLASAQGLIPKHAIKQPDRLLSNSGVAMDQLFAC